MKSILEQQSKEHHLEEERRMRFDSVASETSYAAYI